MSLAEFARMFGVDYKRLRERATHGRDMTKPLPGVDGDELFPKSKKVAGYTLEELAELYSRFRGDEDELGILADFACLPRSSNKVVKLQKVLEKYIEENRKEVLGE